MPIFLGKTLEHKFKVAKHIFFEKQRMKILNFSSPKRLSFKFKNLKKHKPKHP